MILTSKQLAAVQKGQAVWVTVEQTECVVLRKDVYEKMQPAPYDDSNWSEEEMAALAANMFDGLDHPEKIA